MGHTTRIDSPRSWFLDRSVSPGDVWLYILFLRTTYGAFRLRGTVPRQRVFTRRQMFPPSFCHAAAAGVERRLILPMIPTQAQGESPPFQSEILGVFNGRGRPPGLDASDTLRTD